MTTPASSPATVFRFLLALTLFVGITATPAFAQVTIEERMEIRTKADPAEIIAPVSGSFRFYDGGRSSLPVVRGGGLHIRYSRAALELLDALGLSLPPVPAQQVRRLEEGRREAGGHAARLEAGRLASGVYFYRLQAGEQVETGRMVVVR